MAVYKYKAMKSDGSQTTGELVLNTQREVETYLKNKNYYIIEIAEATSTVNKEIEISHRVKKKDLSVFCRKLHTMLVSGLPIVTAIDILKDQTSNNKLKKVIRNISDNIQKGFTFSESLKMHDDVFPNTMIFLIEAGEASGTIDNVLDRLAIDFDKEHKIKNQINAAMVYPIILMVALVGLVIFMMVFILPNFISLYENSGSELPVLTQMVINLSKSIRSYWYLYIIILTLGFMLLSIAIKIPSIHKWIDDVKLRMPLIKTYNQLVITTRFTRTLGTMLYSGVPLLQSLENCANAVGNVVVSEKIAYVASEVRRGSTLSAPIRDIEVFPRMVDSMINIGEESGTLDDILVRTTEYFDEELEVTIKKMLQLFEPIMILLMAGIVGTVVISMVFPMFELGTTIQ